MADTGLTLLGHVAMDATKYALLSPEDRNKAWSNLIRKLNIGDVAYLPVPFRDDSQNLVGMNLIGVSPCE